MTTYLWNPPAVVSLPVRGTADRLPVNRLFFVGRNYHAHAVEMGRPVDKANESPFYFTKSLSTLVESGATVAYPPATGDFQFEMELVLAIGAPGFEVRRDAAHELIYGYACGLDMTRRDLQIAAREQGRPWEVGKAFDFSAPIAPIVRRADAPGVDSAGIVLEVDGTVRQQATVAHLIWSVDEVIANLSTLFTLQPGDLIFTGTPAGVGAVQRGQAMVVRIDGLPSLSVRIE